MRQIAATAGEHLGRFGERALHHSGGALTGAVSGGLSNYLAGGDMDHAIRGAVVGAGMGAVPGVMLRNNQVARYALAAGVPGLLAFQKDRPGISSLFSPGSSDLGSSLYTAERAFEEGSPEWQEYYAENPEAYSARYEKTAASMTLDDIALMEEMSGESVGRTHTKVGTIVDSNGRYTLYDKSGNYTYGSFDKLSEAVAASEKVAMLFRRGRMVTDAAQGTVVYQPGGFGWRRGVGEVVGTMDDSGKLVATDKYHQTVRGAGNRAAYTSAGDKLRREMETARQAPKGGPAYQQQQQTLKNTQGQLKSTQGQLQTSQGQLQTTQGELSAAQKELEAAQKTNKMWGRAAKGLTGAAALAGLGYLGYQYFKPDSWTDRLSNAASGAVNTASKYMPYAQQAMSAMNQGGGGFMGYSANNNYGQYQQMPQQYGRRY